jgi:hypothetical protein
MPTIEVRRRLLAHAATKLGGVEVLAEKLGISRGALGFFLTGSQYLPDAIFLKLVDLICEEWPSPPASPSLPDSKQ